MWSDVRLSTSKDRVTGAVTHRGTSGDGVVPGLAVKVDWTAWNPSILQITRPSRVSNLSSHTVPHMSSCFTSTRPLLLPGTRRTVAVGAKQE